MVHLYLKMANEKNIAYLIGAGASYDALPIVNEIPDKLREMKEYIENYHVDKNGDSIELEDLSKEIEIIQNHASIDTLARKYWLKHQKNLNHPDYLFIKNIITCLLIYCQAETGYSNKKTSIDSDIKENNNVKKKYILDPRYDAFLSAVLTEEFQLPNNISIISWNYDYQIEKAINFFMPEKSLIETGKYLGIEYSSGKSEFNVIKLNGTGFYLQGVDNELNYNLYDSELHHFLFNSLGKKGSNNITSGIKFAWEIDADADTNRKRAAAKIEDAEYIVIIGYSFPIFNREIDIKLFEKIDKCKAIYIQDTPERVELIKNQLDAINPRINEKELVKFQTDLSQFLIPNEYWAEKLDIAGNLFP